MLVASTLFQVMMMTTGSILTGLGKTYLTMRIVILGIIVKFVTSILLAQLFGIYGIVGATMLTFAFIFTLYRYVLRKMVRFSIFTMKQWVLLFVSAAVLALLGYGLHELLSMLIATPLVRLNYMLIASIVSFVLGVGYILLILKFQLVNDEDLSYIPDRVQKVLVRLLAFVPKRFR